MPDLRIGSIVNGNRCYSPEFKQEAVELASNSELDTVTVQIFITIFSNVICHGEYTPIL